MQDGSLELDADKRRRTQIDSLNRRIAMTDYADFKHKEITDKILYIFFKKVYHTLGMDSWKRCTKTRWQSNFAALD